MEIEFSLAPFPGREVAYQVADALVSGSTVAQAAGALDERWRTEITP